MSTTTQERGAELAHRSGDGIDVALFWTRRTNELRLEIFDARDGTAFELTVDGRHALDAFHHPYAYLGEHQ
jgi:hypothetical protein